jgi:hypothetical protein
VCARGNVLVTVVVTVTGCALVIRGRFSLELHGGFLRMVGKSSEFKVLYKNIARMYYLPRPSHASAETVRYCFVISLEEPMRQGQQRYAHLIMQLEVKHVDIPVNLPEVRASVLQCVRQQPLLRAMQHAVRRALSGEWDHGDGMCVCVCVRRLFARRSSQSCWMFIGATFPRRSVARTAGVVTVLSCPSSLTTIACDVVWSGLHSPQLATLFKILTKKKVFRPGSFESSSKQKVCVRVCVCARACADIS